MTPRMFLIFAAFLALGACASTAKAPKRAAPPAAEFAGLPAQQLAAGECGLFLWTVNAPRSLILFARAGSDTAEAALPGSTRKLKLDLQKGDLFGQFMTHLTYSSSDNGRVQVEMVPGETIEGGRRTKSAQVTVTSPDGWETVVPAAGLSACLPQNGAG